MSKELRRALDEVAHRSRRVRLWGVLAVCWLAWAIVASALLIVANRPGGAFVPGLWPLAMLAGVAAATGLACSAAALRADRDPRGIARRIEAHFPALGTGLLAAVEEDRAGARGYLQTAVIRAALDHRRANDWGRTVPDRRILGSQLAHAATLGLFLLAFGALVFKARPAEGSGSPGATAAGTAYEVKVEPGNAEIEKGTALLVVARFGGAVPAESSLVVEDSSEAASRLPMARSLEDPTFAGRVESVAADLAYRVEFAGKSSESYRVRVFEYPELQRADAKLVFPEYTYLEPKTAEDIRHVTAVEGTELTLLCRLNKDVASAKLVDEAGAEVALGKVEGDSHVYSTKLILSESRRFKLGLIDGEGRANKLPSEIVVNVTKNRPPVVALTRPAHDVRVSPVEELTVQAKADDDFGVVRHGFSYSLPGGEPKEIALGDPAKHEKKVQADHVIDFESMKAEPDQLVTYFAWAEDVGPDGKRRRVDGDMFFAEVRHFEEIFRQGEPPPSNSAENEQEQQQGAAQQAEQLAELQKQIINGTWKVVRRETGPKLSEKFAEDSKALRESQASAIEQAAAIGEKLRDPASKASLEQAVKFMKEAESKLAQAVETSAIASEKAAITPEQAAYQALLKLRAREFEVMRRNRQQQQRSGSSSGSPSQRQLDQLELSDEENRYEEQRTAQARQQNQTRRDRQQAENRQVVNRLRELAQRQDDLNDRLKELQSALQAAKDEAARQEIERQLKRLREQQQQILRDTDEVRERLEREENRERLAEARQQLDEGREHVRQASEALEKGQVPQAVTEGARAGKQLNDLKEELRKESANRFSEDLNEMKEQAKQLDETQGELTRKLDSPDKSARPSLREGGEREKVTQALERQRKDLDRLVDRMRKAVEDAEESEPLLAKELYNTVRKAGEQAIPKALEEAEQLADAGIPAEAAKSSRKAGQGIEEVRKGVDRAARSVLGDDTAALKRAQGEIEQLADQIDREMAQATGQPTPDRKDELAQAARNGQDPARKAQEPQKKGQPAEQGQPGEDSGRSTQAGQQGPRANRPGERAAQGDRQPQGRQQGQAGERREPNPQGDRQGEPGQDGRQGAPNPQGDRQQNEQGQQKGQQGGQQGQQGQQPGQQGQEGQQPGQQGQEGQQGQQGGQQGQQGQQGGQQGQQGGQQGQQAGQQRGQGQTGQGRQQGGQQGGGGAQQGGGGGNREGPLDRVAGGIEGGAGNPITGEGFRQWSDRMRDVEELLGDPTLRAEAARIRDRVRGAREEFKRHAKEPDWKEMKGMVADPIRELRDKIAEEVRRRASPDSLVPIDRDPVPPRYAEGVRRYYERLGSGR